MSEFFNRYALLRMAALMMYSIVCAANGMPFPHLVYWAGVVTALIFEMSEFFQGRKRNEKAKR